MPVSKPKTLQQLSLIVSTLATVIMMGYGGAAYADVMLHAPEEIIIVAIDDQELRGGLFRGKNNAYKLDGGTHNIAVKYEQIFYHNSGEHDVLRSNIVTFNNVSLTDGAQYHLRLVNPPKTFEQGENFAQQPTIAIVNAQGQVVAQQTGANSQAKSWFGNKLFGGSYDVRQNSVQSINTTTNSTTNTTTGSTTQPTTVPAVTAPTTSTVSTGSTVSSNTIIKSRDQQLIELWQNATPLERQKFTAWLGSQVNQ